jgi:hypothetical protein
MSVAIHEGYARVYAGPAPERGAHPGYRGHIQIDAVGVHLDEDCEWLAVDNDASQPGGWPMGEWECFDRPQTIPWHKIDSIEWQDEPVTDPLVREETHG